MGPPGGVGRAAAWGVGAVGFPAPVAAALSGASVRQLYYWAAPHGRRPPLLVPEFAASRPMRWSYRDVVALRGLAFLRVGEGAPLQRIRAAVQAVRERRPGHAAGAVLVTSGRTVLWLPDDGDPVDPRTGQLSSRVLVDDVLGPFRNAAGDDVPSLHRPFPRLVVDPAVRGGFPVVAGTTVPFDLVAGLVRDGVRRGRVGRYYPGVDAWAARDAGRLADLVDRVAYRRAA